MHKRPETGPMRFGDDWTGVFIRGDDAFAYRLMCEELVSILPKEKVLLRLQLEALSTLLCRSAHPDAVHDLELQKLPEWLDICKVPE